MESIPHLQINLPRICVMRPTKRQAIVQQEPAVGEVQSGHCGSKSFRKALADRKIESGVRLQVPGNITRAIGEARAVVQTAGRPSSKRKANVEVGMQSMPLIMVQQE